MTRQLSGISSCRSASGCNRCGTTVAPVALLWHITHTRRYFHAQEARLQNRREAKERQQEHRDPKECAGAFWDDVRRTYDGKARDDE